MDFASLGLSPHLARALDTQGLNDPTPIQAGAIPPALAGRDVLGLARTGSGKTAAFGLPMLEALLREGRRPEPRAARALVLAPTRELARQIHDVLAGLAQGSHLRLALVTGGLGFTPQVERLARGVHVLVATPGRLIDLADRRAADLSRTEFLVLDEADQMLDLGFIHALRRIAAMLPPKRQTMMFSATMPKDMEALAAAFLRDPARVQVNPPGEAVPTVTQAVHFVASAAKADLLIELLDAHRDERALVFGRTKHGSDKLARRLEGAGFAVAAIHGNKSQGARDRAVAAFRAGDVRVLVATDVAARGLDIPDVRHVYNHDIPDVPETFVHRIGRTARAGASGSAVALVAPDEMDQIRAVEKLLKAPLPVASGAPWTPEPAQRPARRPQGGSGHKSGHGSGQAGERRAASEPGAKQAGPGGRPGGAKPFAGKPGHGKAGSGSGSASGKPASGKPLGKPGGVGRPPRHGAGPRGPRAA